jgi:hypothetical protein
MEPVVVTELTQTCSEQPSQWEGRIEDGRAIYIHYRNGVLDVGIGDTDDEAVDNSAGWPDDVPFFRAKIGGDMDGYMPETELLERLKDVVVVRR